MQYELGTIGGGNMAEAIVRAAIDRGVLEPARIIVSDPSAERRALFAQLGVAATDRNDQVVRSARHVLLAVKPQVAPGIGDDLKQLDAANQIIISIMAGISIQRIAEWIGKPARIIRTMPNTPLTAGQGMTAVVPSPEARKGDEELCLRIFNAAGKTAIVTEPQLDAVTAVSGSGPAYVFFLAEAMIDAAHALGLSTEQAELLSRQTILGAAHLLADSPLSPAELRRRVTSPGGTTQAAIESMLKDQVHIAIEKAIAHAARRSQELGQ